MLFRKYNPETLSKLSAHQLEQLLRKELAKNHLNVDRLKALCSELKSRGPDEFNGVDITASWARFVEHCHLTSITLTFP